MNYKIVDNFLPKQEFLNIKNKMLGSNFSWYLNRYVAQFTSKDGFYFTHTFYKNNHSNSNEFNLLLPILNKLNIRSLIRAKANLYSKTDKIFEHDKHIDMGFSHRGFIFYINTNNGFTRLENGKKIESIENRGLFFDSSKLHNSSTCTDESMRVNINFNYF